MIANLWNQLELNTDTTECGVLFAAIYRYLRKSKNRAIFKQKISNFEELLTQAESFAVNICNAAGVEGWSELVRNIPVKRKSPCHGWMKINTDGISNVKGN